MNWSYNPALFTTTLISYHLFARIDIFCNFRTTSVLFVGRLIPMFCTSGDVCPRLQSQGGSTDVYIPLLQFGAIYTSVGGSLTCMKGIPQIYLWCDTCWPSESQHYSGAFLIHILAHVYNHWWDLSLGSSTQHSVRCNLLKHFGSSGCTCL